MAINPTRGEADSRIHFPVIQSIQIAGYGLYPGEEGEGLLEVVDPGLTLVIGANGLGKTTLVWILYRMLTGPYDIAGLDKTGDLGYRRLDARKIPTGKRRMFAKRVTDKAQDATCELKFGLGSETVTVRRQLRDMTLTRLEVNGTPTRASEKSYQELITDKAGLWSFGDWILILRHLTFYFEDRRELVWDKSAQREILRILFLPKQQSQIYADKQRAVLKLDSRYRNLHAAVTKEERGLASEEAQQAGAVELREELASVSAELEKGQTERASIDESLVTLDEERKSARLEQLRAEQHRESVFREYERAKLLALQARFPRLNETQKYLLSQLMADGECLACGSHSSEAASALQSRLDEAECVICGTALGAEGNEISLDDARMRHLAGQLKKADGRLRASRDAFESSSNEYNDALQGLRTLDQKIASMRTQLDRLLGRLPKEEAAIHHQREELARLRAKALTIRDDLDTARSEFGAYVRMVRSSLMSTAPEVKEVFEGYAKDFLIEECRLAWSFHREKVGQSGATVEFPSFDFNMASASYHSPVQRTGPEQVSESQREFIDLAFRMALMAIADNQNPSTLVIDAPESSLDAIFVRRAALVLGRFAVSGNGNRLIVTSNLTDGDLIPHVVQASGTDFTLIDLFKKAEPTAAVKQYRSEYDEVKSRLFQSAQGDASE